MDARSERNEHWLMTPIGVSLAGDAQCRRERPRPARRSAAAKTSTRRPTTLHAVAVGRDIRLDIGAGDRCAGSGPPQGRRPEACDGLARGGRRCADAGGKGRAVDGCDELERVVPRPRPRGASAARRTAAAVTHSLKRWMDESHHAETSAETGDSVNA